MKVSYAQNFEDVMLHRAFGDRPDGFYVDVGAHDPTEFSVTRFFYDRGWRGVNVEPVAQYHAALVRERPGDINLQVAAGAEPGVQPLFVVADTGLSTFVDGYASAAEDRGYAVARTMVPVQTLDDIVGRIDPPAVHFLKIDVEGAEGDVLRGVGFHRFRPWIVLVEATQPGTQTLAYDDWEPLLTDRGYAFVWFDGLNRFYVADEQPQLKDAFTTPPNVFDGFIGARQYALEEALVVRDQTLVAQRVEHEAAVASLALAQAEAAHHRTRADDLDARLQATASALDTAIIARTDLAARLDRAAVLLDEAVAAREEERARAGEATARLERSAIEEAARADHIAREAAQLREAHAALIADKAVLEADLDTARELVEVHGSERARLDHELQVTRALIIARDHRIDRFESAVKAFEASRSWRITAPLRALMRLIRRRP